MTPEQMDLVVKEVEKQTVSARALGGYSVEAEKMLIMWEVLLKLVRHLQDNMPKKK